MSDECRELMQGRIDRLDVKLSEIYARIDVIPVLDHKIDAAHTRIDKAEALISAEFVAVTAKLDDVISFMNISKGWTASLVLMAGLIGGAVSIVTGFIFNHIGG